MIKILFFCVVTIIPSFTIGELQAQVEETTNSTNKYEFEFIPPEEHLYNKKPSSQQDSRFEVITKPKEYEPPSNEEIGRYQIYVGSQDVVAPFPILLDTKTGATWILKKSSGKKIDTEEFLWHPIRFK